MSSLLIRNVQLNGNVTNILINGNRFHNLHAPADAVADETYDASGLAIVPSFFNTHTHASMTLPIFRSFPGSTTTSGRLRARCAPKIFTPAPSSLRWK